MKDHQRAYLQAVQSAVLPTKQSIYSEAVRSLSSVGWFDLTENQKRRARRHLLRTGAVGSMKCFGIQTSN